MEENKQQHFREQSLMTSAVYQIGLELHRRVGAKTQTPEVPKGLLNKKRQELRKQQNNSSVASTADDTGQP
jgi:hypothetical protein